MTKQSIVLWVVAFFLTVGSAVYQRMTGPSYPLRGAVRLGGKEVPFKFERSEGQKDAVVKIPTGDPAVRGWLAWKRYRTEELWTAVPMMYRDNFLQAELPVQPPAGKVVYRVLLEGAGEQRLVPDGDPVVIRFTGDVPGLILWPHILVMFLALLLSTRAGLEFFSREPQLKNLTYLSLILLFVGGMVLGPIVQKFAFGAYWTGWPFGGDLTDNKTAVAFLAWVAAALALSRSRRANVWVLAAAIILLLVYLIPHSLAGSELEYAPKAPLTAPR
jgi:hypothetical protein